MSINYSITQTQISNNSKYSDIVSKSFMIQLHALHFSVIELDSKDACDRICTQSTCKACSDNADKCTGFKVEYYSNLYDIQFY